MLMAFLPSEKVKNTLLMLPYKELLNLFIILKNKKLNSKKPLLSNIEKEAKAKELLGLRNKIPKQLFYKI